MLSCRSKAAKVSVRNARCSEIDLEQAAWTVPASRMKAGSEHGVPLAPRFAHIVKDKTEAAYRRSDLFEKRRELMSTWAAFVASTDATVIPLRRPA